MNTCRVCSGSGLVERKNDCRCESVCVCTWDVDCWACSGTGWREAS